MTKLLEIAGVSKGFPGVQALEDVNLSLDAGEVLALVGENGAGKSTLMKILSGIYTKDTGTIAIDGQEVDINGPAHAQHLGISIIHQEMNLMPHLTVAQNIYIGREPKTFGVLKERQLRYRATELLTSLGIRLPATALVGDLTVAQQQMVEIAKALSCEQTKILIMDEPTSAISASETRVLFDLIRNLSGQGVGIVYISHRMEELRQIASTITVLRDGHWIGNRILAEVSDEDIISMMVGRTIAAGRLHEHTPQTPASKDLVLRVTGLCTKRLLRDISFDLHRGEILGFAGLMGAGRTETARAIIGADPHTAGTIEVHGQQLRIARPDIAVKNGIGYLPEDRKHHGLMLEQDLIFNATMASIPQHLAGHLVFQFRKALRTTAEYINSLRVRTPSARSRVRNLSGGNQQKVVIAKWLARNCDVLIFDEPTRGIDVGAKEEIYRLLHRLAQDGKAIIMISSELPELLRVSHRIVVMSGGHITGRLETAQTNQEEIMELATKYIEREGAA